MASRPASKHTTEVLSRLKKIKLTSSGWEAMCPAHDDVKRQSLSIAEGDDGRTLLHCYAGCELEAIVAAVGLTLADLFPAKATTKPSTNGHKPNGIITRYENRTVAGERRIHVRLDRPPEPKKIWWEQPDGTKMLGLDAQGDEVKVRDMVLYGIDALAELVDGAAVVITEGEKAAEALKGAGYIASLATVTGSGTIPCREALQMVSRFNVYLWPDNAPDGLAHMNKMAAELVALGVTPKIITWADAPPKGDAADFLASGDFAGVVRLVDQALPWEPPAEPTTSTIPATPAEAVEPRTLQDVIEAFQRWLYLPDVTPLLAVLGTVAATLMPGDPVWLLLVGPPGGGKTETLQSLARLPRVHSAATLTEPGLLSGSPKRDKAGDATGGLLRSIGDFGIILCKDFGSVLNMNRDARASVLAALREIFDGSWTRIVGVDGGRTLSWSGKVGLIAGCTPTIDMHHAVISAMGERFLLCRLPVGDDDAQAHRALAHVGREAEMRADLAHNVSGLFGNTRHEPAEMDEHERARLVALAGLVVRCRSAVERDGYSREVQLIPDSEAPGRLVTVLAKLLAGLRAIGAEQDAWRVVTKVGLDSMPALRRTMLDQLARRTEPCDTTTLAQAARHPTTTTRRALEDLTAHGVVNRETQGAGKADRWSLSPWARERYELITVPEKLRGNGATPSKGGSGASLSSSKHQDRMQTDISGTPPDANLKPPSPESDDDRCRECGADLWRFTGNGTPCCDQHYAAAEHAERTTEVKV
jgi:hypothetical protein